jgi:energy-converting hydrogenase A subunit M
MITWSLKQVKKGILNRYKIQELISKPVDCQFKIDTEDKIVVADQKKVGL